jgi:predicted acyltransferase
MDQLKANNRLLSLDVMRGVIMLLLAAESCRVYESLHGLNRGTLFNSIVTQFFHHPWHGLRLWDLVQPAFMFMAGTAMYISVERKRAKGVPERDNFRHIALRSLKLFLAGTGLHCIYAGRLVWELWNVLTQLSFTSLVAYFLIRRSFGVQIAVALAMVILNDLLYRSILVPGFDQPFTQGHNFGAYMDTLLMGKINPDGWVAINCIPTAAHTILGVTAGKLLMTPWSNAFKIKALLIAGGIALLLGYGLDLSGISPIIKRISTGGFVLASLGWVTWLLAALYWWIDIRDHKRFTWIAVVVGMNAIFIYLFFETVGVQWLNGAVGVFVKGFTGWLQVPEHVQAVLSAFAVWVLEWYLCYWLYQKKIFFKL